jgi:hypothetical protein
VRSSNPTVSGNPTWRFLFHLPRTGAFRPPPSSESYPFLLAEWFGSPMLHPNWKLWASLLQIMHPLQKMTPVITISVLSVRNCLQSVDVLNRNTTELSTLHR